MSNKAPSCNVPITTIQVSSRLGTTTITITTITFVIIIIIVGVTLTLTQCSNCCFQISARPATSPVLLPHLGPVSPTHYMSYSFTILTITASSAFAFSSSVVESHPLYVILLHHQRHPHRYRHHQLPYLPSSPRLVIWGG